MISVLERIREETRPLHDAIERDSRLSRDDFDDAGYRWSLQKLLGLHAPLEERLKPLTARHALSGELRSGPAGPRGAHAPAARRR